MTEATYALINANIYSGGEAREFSSALQVADGRIARIGSDREILEQARGPVHNLGGRTVVPGLADVHAHLSFGGNQLAHEIQFSPRASLDEILAAVSARASTIPAGQWVVGGIIGSSVMDQLASGGWLEALDAAAGEHPVLLRDDSHHNRWVNTLALQSMGIEEDSADPADGTLVRARDRKLTGVLWEAASTLAEDAMQESILDSAARELTAVNAALSLLNGLGVTTVQEALAFDREIEALASIDRQGGLTARVMLSLPARPGLGAMVAGEDLYALAEQLETNHLRPRFVKIFLDGVPMTRTSALLTPYLCHEPHHDPNDRGPLYWDSAELDEQLRRCYELGWGAKIHATGDRSVRHALDAVERARTRFGDGPIFQIAHVAYVSDEDLSRFASLGVAADASPYMWFPSPFDVSIESQVPAEIVSKNMPLKDLIAHGAIVAGGSDWPVVPVPNPWFAIQTMVTRENPDPAVAGANNPRQALSVGDAFDAFSWSSARAMGIEDETGALNVGLSADFVIIDRDIFAVPARDIAETRVLATFFEGRLVHGQPLAAEDVMQSASTEQGEIA